jgi:FMN reductase
MAEARGARTTLLTGDASPSRITSPAMPRAMRRSAVSRGAAQCRCVIVGSPGYHGTLSGLVKTALDYVELLRGDERVYFDGLPVGLIATAAGWQAAVSTLQALRTITHSLRGWPTPMGLAINTAEPGDAIVAGDAAMRIMVDQIFDFLGS